MYDFSKEHILNSVDGILKRLHTDYLDVLLLRRPDALCDPEEVADTFDRLHDSGKVRYFGLSNHNSGQIRLLQQFLTQPVVANQLQLSITNAGMITSGLNVNMENGASRLITTAAFWIFAVCPISPFSPGRPSSTDFLKGYFWAATAIPAATASSGRWPGDTV